MITATNVTMKFEDFVALNHLNCTIPNGCIYGLVGSNGAGKSTFLRLISGVYRPAEGEIFIDDQPVYENPAVKAQLMFIPDELFFLPGSNMDQMASFYSHLYDSFRFDRYHNLTKTFGLNPRAPIHTFSKGMRRQAATILGLSVMPRFLFFDETFDGLDPVMRNLVKEVINQDVAQRNTTTIITSHSLRELEDTCGQLALLHKGGIVFESDIQNLTTKLFKIQIALPYEFNRSVFAGVDLLNYSQHGTVATFIVRGDREQTLGFLRTLNPVLLDVLPLGLEEVFVFEMEALGYAFKEILM
ncbi:MAG: ABC transporter ATP-binding protein [Eubacteriales bacterium]